MWSPNWEKPYQIKRCAPGDIYTLKTLKEKEDSVEQSNGEYLKEYYPNVWINTELPIRSIASSNSRYQEGIAFDAKINLEG